jgi:ATP-dependent exoDNAse (exonuclease V) beta subunit
MSTAPPLADQSARDQIALALDDTLVVEAAAGTGKTTELVGRIVRVIETGRARVTEIVAVTFTEKAAGELKLRLREELEDARRSAAGGSKERERLDEALSRLEEAQVSTIHGFCADLLRERPVEARVDPLFVVLTEAQAVRMYGAAFERWFQEQLVAPPEGVQRSLRRPSFGGFGSPAHQGDGPIDRLRRAGWDLVQWRDFDGAWQRMPFDREAHIDALVRRLHEFAERLSDPAYLNDTLYQDARPARQLSEDIRRTETVAPRDYHRLEAAFIELVRNRQFQRARKGSGKTYRPGVERADVWRAREDLQNALTRFEADANSDLAALLHQELRGCVDLYQEAKANAGALDFLDLLLKTRDLIADDADVRRSFQTRFKRIFVDEFQDTDPLQAEVLLLLAADDPSVTDWRTVRPLPGKLFIVGDAKQSIYRFRRADMGVYRSVYQMLQAAGAKRVTLSTSFRARSNIQRVINAAFEPAMSGNDGAFQAGYVPLEPFRADSSEQPSVIVLPVPKPYATQRIANTAIEDSLPGAVGAFIEWLIRESGWNVAERPVTHAVPGHESAGETEPLVAIQARHVCLLFRRFVSYGEDMTRPYVEALEARGVPHLLIGGRSFHNRAEIETLRAALAAIEWPDDELSVFATLRGALFAIGDEELLEYRDQFKHFHPFRLPPPLGFGGAAEARGTKAGSGADLTRFAPVVDALRLLQSWHRSRNHVPVAATISRMLEATRAHVRFALEHGGEQVLANVLHVAELARRYEAEGGISFRGFIDELREQAESGEAGEAPILEESSDGVRLMTVHKAKGLEFPVVVLADMTAKLHTSAASRYIDSDRRVCAVRLAGCSPHDLLQHETEELQREDAEGVRVAYVAATRARDLLVVPAVGDEEREGWIEPLNRVIYPPPDARRQQTRAAGCPEFRSKDSVLSRPNGDPAGPSTVCPGLHAFKASGSVGGGQSEQGHTVVWWDPHALTFDAEAPLGIRHPELIVKDVAPNVVEAGLSEYNSWRTRREAAVAAGSLPQIAVQTVTQWARAAAGEAPDLKVPAVEIIELPRAASRPSGPRFGTLVHSVLATVPLDGDIDAVKRLTEAQARTLGATADEVESAGEVVEAVLAHPLLERAREAAKAGHCRREVPIAWREKDGGLVEGVIDLAFKEDGRWALVDFKTEEELRSTEAAYRRQLGLYAAAVASACESPVSSFLLYL